MSLLYDYVRISSKELKTLLPDNGQVLLDNLLDEQTLVEGRGVHTPMGAQHSKNTHRWLSLGSCRDELYMLLTGKPEAEMCDGLEHRQLRILERNANLPSDSMIALVRLR